MKNAADPAAEVVKFVAFYTSRGWADAQGRAYDTPEKRVGLAYGWDCKSGKRLPDTEDTKRFLDFLGDLYEQAQVLGGINPMQLIENEFSYVINKDCPGLNWRCRQPARDWVESHSDVVRPILFNHYGQGAKLYYILIR